MKKMVAAGALVALAFALTGCAQANRETHESCTVEEKDRAGSNASSYRVYTDCGVFSIEDDLIEGRWNAADDYHQIEVGATYDFETIGWRNGFLSLFPNIVKSERVS